MSPITIDDGATYKVTLAKAIPRVPRKLLPRDSHRMTGAILREIVEAHGWEAIDHVSAIS